MILCSGCFDGLHAGHVAYLQAAAQLRQDEPLYVAVAPDRYIRQRKQREPRWSQAERAQTVAAVRGVTGVITRDELDVDGTIRIFRPTLFVKGEDWTHQLPTAVVEACQETGTAIAFVHTPGRHTREAFR